MNAHESHEDALRSAWHDRMNGENDTSPGEAESLSPEQQRQLADEQLLHALLVHRYTESEESGNQRVGRVLRSITPRPRKPLWFRLASATVSSAAVLLLAVVLVEFLLPEPSVAMSEFNRVVNAFLTEGDRAYSVQFTMQGPPDRPSQERRSQPQASPSAHHGGRGKKFDGAMLYLRGGAQYVFEMKLPQGKTIWIGRNDDVSWAVCPRRPVLVSQDRDAFRLPFFEEMTTLPLIDVRDTLQAAKHGYELDRPKRVALEDGRAADYFLARRRGSESRRPERIELWADPHTGLLYRMVCSKMRFSGVVCRQLRMDYVRSQPQSGNWFDYQGHCSPEAKVKTVTKEDVRRLRQRRKELHRKRWKRHRVDRPLRHDKEAPRPAPHRPSVE